MIVNKEKRERELFDRYGLWMIKLFSLMWLVAGMCLLATADRTPDGGLPKTYVSAAMACAVYALAHWVALLVVQVMSRRRVDMEIDAACRKSREKDEWVMAVADSVRSVVKREVRLALREEREKADGAEERERKDAGVKKEYDK